MILEPCCCNTKLIPHIESIGTGHVITNGDVPLHKVVEAVLSRWNPTVVSIAAPNFDANTLRLLRSFSSGENRKLEVIVHRTQVEKVVELLQPCRTTIATLSAAPPMAICCARENGFLTLTGELNHEPDIRQHIISFSTSAKEYEKIQQYIIKPTIRLKRYV